MSLDTTTLYLIATMVAAMLGAMLLFFSKQENIPALKWWGAAYLLGAGSVALWTLAAGALGEMLSLALNAAGFWPAAWSGTPRAFSRAASPICRGWFSAARLDRRRPDASAGASALR